jgi:hypothetical protein
MQNYRLSKNYITKNNDKQNEKMIIYLYCIDMDFQVNVIT